MSGLVIEHLCVFSTEEGVDWQMDIEFYYLYITCLSMSIFPLTKTMGMKFISIQYSQLQFQHDLIDEMSQEIAWLAFHLILRLVQENP